MNNPSNIIRTFEHSTLIVDDSKKFKTSHFKMLEKYGYSTNEKYFSVGNKRIKFNKYVGVIHVKNLTIEVLPKADKEKESESLKDKWHNALIEMLKISKLVKINPTTNAKLRIKPAPILNLFYDFLLSEIEYITKQGLKKNYRSVKENLNKVKGKIAFTEHIRKNAFHKERFYVKYKTYDNDIVLNQILLKALLILKEIAYNAKFSSRINQLLLFFDGVSHVGINEQNFQKIRFDRSTERYRRAISLSKLIILGYAPDLKGGKENVVSIMFDMNYLYENYIFQKLKVLQNDVDNPVKRVRRKNQNTMPFWESRRLEADIVLETEEENIVIDTKWKIIKNNKPSNEDLKQMLIYNLHYNSKHSVLLYPKVHSSIGVKKPFKNKSLQEHYCQVAFADIFNKQGKLEKNLGDLILKDICDF